MKYFVWIRSNGRNYPQVWYDYDFSKNWKKAGNTGEILVKIELPAEEHALSLQELTKKYPIS